MSPEQKLTWYLSGILNYGNTRCPSTFGDRLRSKLATFCKFAADLALLSTCSRSKVGCVAVSMDLRTVPAIGYNGPPAGEANDACRGTAGNCGCIHAESNALVKLRESPSCGLLLVQTMQPCEHCAGLILNSGAVKAVLYRDSYRDKTGLDLLTRTRRKTDGRDGIIALSWKECGTDESVAGWRADEHGGETEVWGIRDGRPEVGEDVTAPGRVQRLEEQG